MPALTPEQESLKQAALATDGAKWETEGFEQTFGNGTFYGGLIMHENGHTIIAQQVLSPHAEFIAAANPAAILAILAQLESYITEYEKVADRLAQLEAAQEAPANQRKAQELDMGYEGVSLPSTPLPGSARQDGCQDEIRAAFERKFPLAVWDVAAGGYTQEMYTYALAGYRTAALQQPVQAVPDGMVLVPREATEAMMHAAEDVPAPRPYGAAWRAMIAAAPVFAPGEPGQ
jgi:hypothetical protein